MNFSECLGLLISVGGFIYLVVAAVIGFPMTMPDKIIFFSLAINFVTDYITIFLQKREIKELKERLGVYSSWD